MLEYPVYSYPPLAWPQLVASAFLRQKRSFRRDGLECIGRIEPPLQVIRPENIPLKGPLLLVFNHYYRPGFQAWWMALGLSALIPVDIHFVMTGALTFPGRW